MITIRLAFILCCITTPAYGADSVYCTLYSREMIRSWIRSLPAESLPNVTVNQISYRLTRFWTLCLNRDDPPEIKDLPTDARWAVSLWSELQRNIPRPEGSVPAGPDPTPDAPPPAPSEDRPPPRRALVAADDPKAQAVCVRAHMRTVYLKNGKSWRCRR